jgi:hypothetical protein
MITIVKCCDDEDCDRYGLSDGHFNQGNGWEKERAQEYADAINAYDADQRLLAAVAEVGRKKRATMSDPIDCEKYRTQRPGLYLFVILIYAVIILLLPRSSDISRIESKLDKLQPCVQVSK